MSEERTRIIAGCMTGTSLDGLDVALVRVIGTGLEMRAELIAHHAVSMPDRLRSMLMSFAQGEAAEPVAFMRAARALGRLHLEALQALLAGGLVPPSTKLDFVTAHGQTIWHAPGDAPRYDAASGPKSWQLFDPWPIVRGLKVPVCYDLRQADLIAGGEGAPLTPIADWVMYRGENKRVVMNLGGICNATVLPASELDLDITAFDLGPCNLLIDGLVQQLFPGERYDKDGMLSMQGGLWEDVSALVLKNLFFQRPWPRSSGREDFNSDWIESLIASARTQLDYGVPSDADIVASAIYAIADDVVSSFIRKIEGKPELILAGGGAHNPSLLDAIRSLCEPITKGVIRSDALGIPCEAREAMGFAVLGALSQDGVPISLPQVTGSTDPGVAGVWAYP